MFTTALTFVIGLIWKFISWIGSIFGGWMKAAFLQVEHTVVGEVTSADGLKVAALFAVKMVALWPIYAFVFAWFHESHSALEGFGAALVASVVTGIVDLIRQGFATAVVPAAPTVIVPTIPTAQIILPAPAPAAK
jgi:hypothetical protein